MSNFTRFSALICTIFLSGICFAAAADKGVRLPVLTGYKVKLDCVSPRRSFPAGEPAELTFRLHNVGKRPLLVYEWRQEEAKNLQIFYAEVSENIDPDSIVWQNIIPEITAEDRPAPLDLSPNNAALITVRLPFVEDIKSLAQGKSVEFMIYVKLNLKTISAQSPVYQIIVAPSEEE